MSGSKYIMCKTLCVFFWNTLCVIESCKANVLHYSFSLHWRSFNFQGVTFFAFMHLFQHNPLCPWICTACFEQKNCQTREHWIHCFTFATETNADTDTHTGTAWRRATQYLLRLLSAGEGKDIERVQKHRLRCLYPSFSYSEALSKSGLDRLDYHRGMITQNVFRQNKDPKHPLHYLLPPVSVP